MTKPRAFHHGRQYFGHCCALMLGLVLTGYSQVGFAPDNGTNTARGTGAEDRSNGIKSAPGAPPANWDIIIPNNQFGPGSTTEELVAGLRSKDALTRIEAIRALWSTNRPAAGVIVPVLTESLEASGATNDFTPAQRSRVRAEAALVLGLIGPDAKSAIPGLVEVLQDPDEWARENAVDAIRTIAPCDSRVLPALIKAMEDKSVRVQRAANAALVETGPVNIDVIRAFIRAMRTHAELFKANPDNNRPPGDIVLTSEDFFSSFGPEQRYAKDDLAALARDKHPGIERIAFIGLNGIGEIPEEFVPLLVASLPDPVALAALKIMGPKAQAAVPQLTGFMEDTRARPIAAELLASIGAPAARPAIPVFERLINEGSYPALYLCEDLLKIDSSSAAAHTGFEKLTTLHAKTLSDQLTLLVAHARLIQSGREPQEHIEFLKGKLGEPNEALSASAVKLLLECRVQGQSRKEALSCLFDLLEKGQNAWALGIAEQGLASLGPSDKEYVPRLVPLIGAIPELPVIAALGQIGPDAKEALPRLKQLLQYRSRGGEIYEALHGTLDPDSKAVRKTAKEAIQKIAEM